tara:strand:- start:5617 stop:6345 length:729 start_codon:yes stop_codon:yes gene_type:complete
MGLTISSSGGDYENLEAGRYKATCYKLIDAGTREESYQDGPLRKRQIVYIYWEVTHKQEVDDGEEHWEEVRMADGRPFAASKKYTASLNENAALFKDLKSWRGRPFSDADLASFELPKVLGVTAELEMIKQNKDEVGGRVKVEGVYKPEGGMKKVTTFNDLQSFDIDVYAQEFSGKSTDESKIMCDMVEDMPPWMQEMIQESFEVQAAHNKNAAQKPAPASGGLADLTKDDTEAEHDDNIPF